MTLQATTLNLLVNLKRVGAKAPELVELFDYLDGVLLWVKDTKGRFEWVNMPFVVSFGLKSRSDVLGLTDFDLSESRRASQYVTDDERVLRGERIVSRIELVGCGQDMTRWCRTSKVPLRDSMGKIVGTAGITHPILDPTGSKGSVFAEHHDTDLDARLTALTTTERAVVIELYQGLSNREIAEKLGKSVKTVKGQLTSIYRKLSVRSRSHLQASLR